MSTPVIANIRPDTKIPLIILQPAQDKSEIGVEETRAFIKELSYTSDKIAIIDPADRLTVAAQNALLKTLEEPPANTKIYLITNQPNSLLPTILSRCLLESSTENMTQSAGADVAKVLNLIQENKISDGFVWAEEKSKNRQVAMEIIDELIKVAPREAVLLSKLILAKKYLKANANTRLVLENLFI